MNTRGLIDSLQKYKTLKLTLFAMRKIKIFLMCFVTISANTAMQAEILHLLRYVKNTKCQYERNGSLHNGLEAAEHINKKYQYYKDDIKTSEDFIQYAASKSKFSGKYYQIVCPEQVPIKSQSWLLLELNRYRKQFLPEKN